MEDGDETYSDSDEEVVHAWDLSDARAAAVQDTRGTNLRAKIDATLRRKSSKTARHSWQCFVISLSLRCSHLKVTSYNSVNKQTGALQVIEIVMIIIIGYRDEPE